MNKKETPSGLKRYICPICQREYFSFMKLEKCFRCVGKEAYERKEKEKGIKKKTQFFPPPSDRFNNDAQ